ncbi:4'-phosphopantetheinyl transferase family protein [Streptomyces sp. NPDC054949]|uniref:4'-phosphopantetheinyl transferase family protein n=1 Tax=unclassified Streptomyces TaxID=2593676 RepID=UPI000AEAF195|nr:4'-phosphopantetheinyl transferase superfamily protein [Streptomyces sp. WM4235]
MSAGFAPRRVTVVVAPTAGLRDAESRSRVLDAAAALVGVGPGGLRLGHEENGRPRLFGLGGGVHVSLSHGRGVAALALTGLGPLGVDVEVERPLRAVALAERWFTPPEADWLKEQEERMRVAAYFWLWTHKEAMGKAYGTGLDPTAFLRAAPTPPRWPAGREPAPRLLPLPREPELSVSSPFLRDHVTLTVAVLGREAGGAPVDVHVCAPL